MLEKDLYLYLSSDSSQRIFPNNRPCKFIIRLPEVIRLQEGKWCIALLDIDFPKFDEDYKPAYVTVETNICEASVYGDIYRPVLHRFYFNEIRKSQPVTIGIPRYIPVSVLNASQLEIHITDDSKNYVSFRAGATRCTLHLTKASN